MKDCKNDFKPQNSLDKIKWSDLSAHLKIAVGIAYFVGSLYLLIFISGFIQGIMGIE